METLGRLRSFQVGLRTRWSKESGVVLSFKKGASRSEIAGPCHGKGVGG